MNAQRTKLVASIIALAFFTFIASQRNFGFFLIVVSPVIVGWLIARIHGIVTRPQERSRLLVGLYLCTASIVLIAGIHVVRHVVERNQANEIVASIEQYAVINKRYPAKLEELGYDFYQVRRQLGYCGYTLEGGQPHFSYAVPYTIFEMYSYDFHSKSWKHRGS